RQPDRRPRGLDLGRPGPELRGPRARLARLRRDPARDAAGVRVHNPGRGRRADHDDRPGNRLHEPPVERTGGLAMAKTDNSVVIDRPLDEVWERMNDLENWTNLFTEY